jgi:Tfp pilus assembly protein PilN
MIPRINLLPAAYREARRRRRRIRAAVGAGAVLLVVELTVALGVHWRAGETRTLLVAADAAQRQTATVRKQLDVPRREADSLGRQVALAERLRTKHYWSRLLGAIGRAIPENVVLTSVATDPAQWAPSLRRASAGAASGEARRLVEGVTVTGHASDHADLSVFVSAMYRSGVFDRIELRQARRDKSQGRESIAFELGCRW